MTLYLSRLLLALRSRRVQQELAHPYEMHRTLLRAFPDEGEAPSELDARERRRASGVLFRADQDPLRNTVTLYVQSFAVPDWAFLTALGPYLDAARSASSVAVRDLAPVYQGFRSGQLLAFRLRANPTKRVGRPDAPNTGKRVELVREDEQIAWLERKGRGTPLDPGGFELDHALVRDAEGAVVSVPRVQTTPEGKRFGRKFDAGVPRALVHSAVLFEGALRITDPDAFRKTIARGIGSGKAFGFGLLSLAPRRTLPGE